MGEGSLTVVGTGIRSSGHLTAEAKAAIEAADVVLFAVADPVAEERIKALNPAAVGFIHYIRGKPRRHTYRKWVEQLLDPVRDGKRVCAVLYGHPGVLGYTAHSAIREARGEGFRAEMLPAVSALDCLVADVGVDPGTNGLQCFEAMNFLIYGRSWDPQCPLVLFQIGAIGLLEYTSSANPEGLSVLTDVLLDHYDPSHEVIVYQANQHWVFDANLNRLSLGALPEAAVTLLSTLYVPPRERAALDTEMVNRLGLESSYFED